MQRETIGAGGCRVVTLALCGLASLIFTAWPAGAAREKQLGTGSAAKTAAAKTEKLPSIAFEKYKLKNGLEVILSEDHSLPLVSVNVWYHVGPAYEVPGRTGFAHLFEHMMFQGSEHVGPKAHIRYLESAGRLAPDDRIFAVWAAALSLMKRDPRMVGVNLVAPEDHPLAREGFDRQMRPSPESTRQEVDVIGIVMSEHELRRSKEATADRCNKTFVEMVRKRLEDELNAVTDEADRMVGRLPVSEGAGAPAG